MKKLLTAILISFIVMGAANAQTLKLCQSCGLKINTPLTTLSTGDTVNVQYTIINTDSAKDAIVYVVTNLMFLADSGVVSNSKADFHFIKAKDSALVTGNVIIKNKKSFNLNTIVIVWPTGNGLQVAPTNEFRVNRTVTLVEELGNSTDLIKVYPNPFSEGIYITAPASEKIESISISDLSGRILLKNQGYAEHLNLENFSKGIYFVKVQTADGVRVCRLMKGL
ncbi:MAG: T9SS type A sorting domain-containing protein [Bacteroidetes bacterium]|nr:T9SS type A sorting domain-containing protein [Bacteroidota bacterium]